MAPERVTITITSSAGEDAPLTVHDAMRQVLDFFELLSAAGGEEAASISWRLVAVSMQSPLSATAEAFPEFTGVSSSAIATSEKRRIASSIHDLTTGAKVPDWMSSADRQKARVFFERVLNGIGRADIKFGEGQPITTLVARDARLAVAVLDQHERDIDKSSPDLSRTEWGSIEGEVAETTTFYRKPALRIKERLLGAEVLCLLSEALAERVGRLHSWSDVWSGRRVIVPGKITFDARGRITQIRADDIRPLDPLPISYDDIKDTNFTGGLGPSEYLRQLWEDEDVG